MLLGDSNAAPHLPQSAVGHFASSNVGVCGVLIQYQYTRSRAKQNSRNLEKQEKSSRHHFL